MPSLVFLVVGAGFIALAAFLVVHVARDIKAPTEGERIHKALAHLEKNLRTR